MFIKAIVLSETEFNMLVSDLFENFLEEHIDDHVVDDKIIFSPPEEAEDFYKGFKDYLYAEFDFILENNEVDMIMIYYDNDWREIYKNEDFIYLVEDSLNISDIISFIEAIKENIGMEVDINE